MHCSRRTSGHLPTCGLLKNWRGVSSSSASGAVGSRSIRCKHSDSVWVRTRIRLLASRSTTPVGGALSVGKIGEELAHSGLAHVELPGDPSLSPPFCHIGGHGASELDS